MKAVDDKIKGKISMENERKKTDNNNTINQIRLLCTYLYYMRV